ncbi:DUF1700 domain-containing protein [Agrobacterium tumefaciens]|uniref:DUF1700 domain-containing protein n=1 Tax=Agrobacterium tumefaciens TaxID=358 RepID=UPI0015717A8E|nr:DUF1700 domain-containing protein [Agrobacterium tumefaciens]
MNSEIFLRTLRTRLSGLRPKEIDDIVGDYASHIADGRASGRSEPDIVGALGDPARLARELRAEAGLKRFEDHGSLANLLTAILALAGLAMFDVLFLIPLLLIATIITIGIAFALLLSGIAGANTIYGSLFGGVAPLFEAALQFVGGLSLVFCLIFGSILLTAALGLFVRFLGRYARFHFHLLDAGRNKP